MSKLGKKSLKLTSESISTAIDFKTGNFFKFCENFESKSSRVRFSDTNTKTVVFRKPKVFEYSALEIKSQPLREPLIASCCF